jgi:glycosyltransferase involved in cell wall biosynthesis
MSTKVENTPTLSIVVLCYESQDFIVDFCEQLLTELQTVQASYEIILVANYDKSSDKTPKIAQSLEKQYEEVVALVKKKEGKMGWDMRMGLEKAQGKFIAVIDGDGQMPASDIPLVYNLISQSHFDLVKTYRSVRMDGLYRTILSRVYNLLFNLLFAPPFSFKDVNAKPKILRRSAYEQLNLQSNDWFTDAEIMIQALKHELAICEVATVFRKNERRASFVSMRTAVEFLVNLFKYRLQK